MASSIALSFLRNVSLRHRLFAICHVGLFAAAIWGAASALQFCPGPAVVASFITAAASAIRILWMVGSGVTQAAVASTMMAEELDSSASTLAPEGKQKSRRERRMWYARWLWWGRCGIVVSLLQVIGAAYFSFFIVKYASSGSDHCYSAGDLSQFHEHLFLSLAVMAWVLAIMQCCIGSNILAWSSLYVGHDEAWRAYYHEMFDYRIREALCCLGRAQYVNARDEDEVDSVAAILGDLVSYRAAGAGHLEFLAGLALLQIQGPHQLSVVQFPPAPEALMREATVIHPYAVAAYTGPLLDAGRNPLSFPCVWLYRQGLLTFWRWNSWPQLDGDNWWRGHAAAFLKHLRLPPEALRRGRICQAKRESAYFVTVVHQCQWVVVAVRGTETPEDLLTDGLGRQCMLTESDLHGLLESKHVPESSKQHLLSTMPHFGHKGIIEAARELALQLDSISDTGTGVCSMHNSNNCIITSIDSETSTSKQMGLLSSLLGPGGECEGYSLRFVGHSLGGSIAALTAIRLYARYPQLHVYGYGVLPCVDVATADACSSFVTSIVYNDEFSSRLSVSSVKRLRVAAVRALASETRSESGTITRLARQLFGSEQPAGLISSSKKNDLEPRTQNTVTGREYKHKHRRYKFELKGGSGTVDGAHEESEVLMMSDEPGGHGRYSEIVQVDPGKFSCPQSSPNGEECAIQESTEDECAVDTFHCPYDDQINPKIDSEYEGVNPEEIFLPGLVIHLVPVNNENTWNSWLGWRKGQQSHQHRAVIKDRQSFQDIIISPSMFLDHMPWRCQYALNSMFDHVEATMPGSHLGSDDIV